MPGTPCAIRGWGASRCPARPRRTRSRISCARSLVRVLPALLILVGAFYDYFTPMAFTEGPLFTAAPLVAAPLFSLRGTVLTGVTAFVAVLTIHIRLGIVFKVDALTEVATVATVGVLAVLINILVRRTDERLASAHQIAEAASVPSCRNPTSGSAASTSRRAIQGRAGGRVHRRRPVRGAGLPHGVRLVVGEHTREGHGRGGRRRGGHRGVPGGGRAGGHPEAVAQRLERALAREGTRREGLDAFEGFTTAVLAEIAREGGLVRIVNRGHPPPLLLHADGTLVTLAAAHPALPLGMGELGSWPDRAEETEFPAGELAALFHTDGLSEARDTQGRFYNQPRAWPDGPSGPEHPCWPRSSRRSDGTRAAP